MGQNFVNCLGAEYFLSALRAFVIFNARNFV